MAKATGETATDKTLLDFYARGMTPREIGPLVELSHQSVRNRLIALGVNLRSQSETAALRRRLTLDTHGDAIRETFLRTLSTAQTAEEVGVAKADVEAHLTDPGVLPDYRVLAGRPRTKRRNYSDADLVSSLQEAAATASSPLTVTAYIKFHSSSPTLADGRPRPGHQTMMRVGTWGVALQAAGLPANPPGGPLSPNDPVKALLSLVSCWDDLDKPPTVGDYDVWQRGKDNHPGSKTARKLLGSWPFALIRAWQIRYGIELDQADTEVAIPPGLTAATTSSPFVPYSPASDETVFQRRKQELESGLEGLTEAVQNHNRIQNELSVLLKQRGREPLSPALAPAFDLAFLDHDGSVVVVEVESATPANLEGQLRLGLGQILRYAHQLKALYPEVKPALLIQLEPSDDWKALIEELGVTLLYETELAAGVDALLGA